MAPKEATKIAGRWKALLICPNRKLTAELMPLLQQHVPPLPVAELAEYPNRAGLQEISRAEPANICFLDVSSDREKALGVITDLAGIDPAMKIVALMGENDPDLILRTLRQGATEFLIRPFTTDQFQPSLERLAKLLPTLGNGSSAKVYCVMPAKGACGASTVACALAFQLKRGGRRVLLADLDPLTGTISFLLKLKSMYSFLDVLSRSRTLDGDLWKGLVATSHGVDVLLSPDVPTDGMAELQDASPIIDYSRAAYDAVVVDTSGAYGEWSLALARLADDLVLVTTNELPALQASQRVLSYFDRHHVDRSKIRLVVNRFSKEVGLNKEMIETALRTDVFHVLPSDYEAVQRALMEGKPVPSNSSLGKSLATLAERLAGKELLPATGKPQKSSPFGGLLSLFSRG